MQIDNMSGLEIMQAMISAQIALPTMCKTMPMKVVEATEGRVLFEVQADGRHLNVLGGIHGGFATTVMDSITGCAVHTFLAPGDAYATVDLNVKMLRPVPINVPLVAEGTVLNMSKSLGVSQGVLRDQAGKLYAHATATCMLMRKIT
jgi:uncharacterized protein (TIGR00369 family)